MNSLPRAAELLGRKAHYIRRMIGKVLDQELPDWLATDSNRSWGFTGPANKSAVWRSGAGITADGEILWVGGPGLSIEALADTLVRAGAIRGMQLEINQEWVQFNTYSTNAAGTTTGKQLLSGMQHTGDRWLAEDTRDFIAVFAPMP